MFKLRYLLAAGLVALGLTGSAEAGRTSYSFGYHDGYSSIEISSRHGGGHYRGRADYRIDGSYRYDRRYRGRDYYYGGGYYRPCPPPVYYRPCPPPVYYRPRYRSYSYGYYRPSVTLGYGYRGSHSNIGFGVTIPINYESQPLAVENAYEPQPGAEYASTYSRPSRNFESYSTVESTDDLTVRSTADVYRGRVVSSTREVIDNRPAGEGYQANTYYKNNGRMDLLGALRAQQEQQAKDAEKAAPAAAPESKPVDPVKQTAVQHVSTGPRMVDLREGQSVRTVSNRVAATAKPTAAPAAAKPVNVLQARYAEQQATRVQNAGVRRY